MHNLLRIIRLMYFQQKKGSFYIAKMPLHYLNTIKKLYLVIILKTPRNIEYILRYKHFVAIFFCIVFIQLFLNGKQMYFDSFTETLKFDLL